MLQPGFSFIAGNIRERNDGKFNCPQCRESYAKPDEFSHCILANGIMDIFKDHPKLSKEKLDVISNVQLY